MIDETIRTRAAVLDGIGAALRIATKGIQHEELPENLQRLMRRLDRAQSAFRQETDNDPAA